MLFPLCLVDPIMDGRCGNFAAKFLLKMSACSLQGATVLSFVFQVPSNYFIPLLVVVSMV